MLRNVSSNFLWVTGFCLLVLAPVESHAWQQDSVSPDSLRPAPDFIAWPFPEFPSALWHVPQPGLETFVVRGEDGRYTSYRYLFGMPVAIPWQMDFGEYSRRTFEALKRSNWEALAGETAGREVSGGGPLDFSLDIPAGDQSTFTTIFGKPEVNLRINGVANMNLGASIQTTENPEIPPDQQTQVDPTFDQNLQLNIQGTIGDKLSIGTDWDTERPFDFENRLSIVYQGYEDEILQSIQMGNVFMETGNSLIRGGSSLFGIKSVARLGALRVTSVLSRQEGEGRTETISGGAREQPIAIRPAGYEDDRHFFLDFYTRQEFEQNMSDPQQPAQALQLTEVNVWMLRESTRSGDGERQAIAMVDLGVNESAPGVFAPPDQEQDPFSDALLDQFRDPSTGVSAADFGVDAEAFVEGYFIPLQEGSDYEVDRSLGYLTILRNLGSRQAVAISFRYLDPQTGETVSVGEVSQGGNNRIYLKLIRPQNVTTTNPAWDLMMKNIYATGVQNLTEDGLEMEIRYTEQNIPSNSLPGRNTLLLQDLGLDRVDRQGAPTPDNRIDFSTGTLNPVTGRILFPWLEPFGDRVAELLAEAGLPPDRIEDLAFDELYTERRVNAAQNARNSFYLIEGEAKGAISDSYSLGISLVEGSVRVYANGTELQEGSDYAVDYSIGSITILNQRYLQRGQEIRIEYENNQFSQIEQKTFTGLRAEYALSDDIHFGTTWFRLKERPLQDKIRIGEEPVNNAVFGFDADAQVDVPWLTRMVDRVPLLQTTAPSMFSLSGEFAQLRPDVSRTGAVEDAIGGNRLFTDEENGLVFLDDFEGVDIGLSFVNPSRWHLAAAPAAVPGYAPDETIFTEGGMQQPSATLGDKIARSDLRSRFSWYTIPRNITEILNGVEYTPESQPVAVTDVFPNRDVLSEENFITTLDVHYAPGTRGPYNYNSELRTLLESEPGRTWGGMVTTLPGGQEDLSQNNIEFLEFWVQPVLPGGELPTSDDLQAYDGTIYIDIGTVSEDVIPNFKTNTEDGLVRRPEDLEVDNPGGEVRSYLPSPPPPPEGQFSNELRELEDVGLDGAPDEGGLGNRNEQVLFNSFIESARLDYGTNSSLFQEISEDPSGDNYVYYGEDRVADEPLHRRFHRMFGYHDGNTPPNTDERRAVTNRPDTEGLITPSVVEHNDAYFQYEIDWNPADFPSLDVGVPGTFIVDRVPGENQGDRWYQVRIPLQDFVRRVGNIENFQNISYIRIWMSGYEQPFTMRFASLELVGSQWRPAENVHRESPSSAEMTVSTVNIEENSRRRPIPYRQPEGAIRATDRSRQRRTIANEQSLVLEVQDLGPGEVRMVKRVYPGGLNMLHYSNVRMFVHGEGYDGRDEAELVVRFGTDLVNNYYEYRQPVTPSDPDFPWTNQAISDLSEGERELEAEQVWLYEENSMNLILRALNQLKQLRDQQEVDNGGLYERGDLLEDAPEGAVLAIRGNPSLDRVGEIGMGIRNPFDPAAPGSGGTGSLDGQFWLNELRVSGFDNKNGWAANARTRIQMADFATLSGNLVRETDGFGSLNSRLGQRQTADLWGFDMNGTVNMHRFIPERHHWNIPLSLTMRRSLSTPRYLPNQGDVRLSEFRDAVDARGDLNEEQKRFLIDRRVEESQTAAESYSVSLSNLSKSQSESALGRYVVDNTTLNYVWNSGERRSPQYRFQNSWNYSGSLIYGISFAETRLFRPLDFLGGVPLLHPLAGLRLGYTPSRLSAGTGINREYDERQRRPLDDLQQTPLQQSHQFNYNTSFGFGYNLMPSVATSFSSRTIFDLSRAGVEEIAGDSSRFRVRPTLDVIGGVFADSLRSRRGNYEEGYTAGWRPRLDRIGAIDWVSYSAAYTGGYQWRNSAVGSGLGSTVSNNLTLNQSLDLDFADLLGRSDWYRGLRGGGSASDTASSGVLRTLAGGLLSIESVDVSFDLAKSSVQAGYGGDSQIYHMFNRGGNRFSPPFIYRTGILDRIGIGQLIDNPNTSGSVLLPSNRRYSDNLSVGSRWVPVQNLTVDLQWDARWDGTASRQITIDPDQTASAVQTRSGNISSSVWSFGGGYGSFFRRQLQTAFGDLPAPGDTLRDATGNRDGRTVLDKQGLQEDFRGAYLGIGAGTVGQRNFMPFPLPGWRIAWSGLQDLFPFMGEFMSRATLIHSFSGRYRLGWVFNADTSPYPPLTLGGYVVRNNRPRHEPNSINIEKNYLPLIGMNIVWHSNLRTNLQYEYSKLSSLSLSNTTVTERLSRGVTLSFGYTVRDFKIPLFPRIRNAVDFTVNTSFIEDTEQKFVLVSDLDNALRQPPGDPEDYPFTESFTGGQSRINGSAVIGYQFSQAIRANFEYSYSRLIPKSSGIYARTDHDLRFNVIVSIRSD